MRATFTTQKALSLMQIILPKGKAERWKSKSELSCVKFLDSKNFAGCNINIKTWAGEKDGKDSY